MNDRKITFRLASIPIFAKNEYHPNQVEYYAKITELVYRAFGLDAVSDFLRELVEILRMSQSVDVRIMRLPSHKSKILGIDKKGRILDVQLYGRSWEKKPLVDIFPNSLFPDKLSKPFWSIGLRGLILNSSIRTIIHELLHKSGLNDEEKVRELTERYYKDFRRKYTQTFNDEIKPLLKEWKQFEKQSSLR
jgi:hypothetical protein